MKVNGLALELALLGTPAGAPANLDAFVYPAFCGKPLHRSTGAR